MEIRQTDNSLLPLSATAVSANAAAKRTASSAEGDASTVNGDSPSTIVSLQSVPSRTADADNNGEEAAADSESGKAPSAAKSFTYGVLGLSQPLSQEEEAVAKPENPYFTAGKLLAAAATVGTIISLVA